MPLPSPGDLPNPGIEPGSPTLQADALPSEPPGKGTLFKMKKSEGFPGKVLYELVSNGHSVNMCGRERKEK